MGLERYCRLLPGCLRVSIHLRFKSVYLEIDTSSREADFRKIKHQRVPFHTKAPGREERFQMLLSHQNVLP